jgi:DNA-binding CsgD family transcriptional regulator
MLAIPLGRPDAVHPIVLAGPGDRDTALAAAVREVRTVRVGPGAPLRPVDRANLRRGVRYRVLVPAHEPSGPVPATAELRLLAGAAAELTVIDRTVAILPVDGAAGRVGRIPASGRGIPAAVLRLPAVIDAVVAQFESLWAAAAPAAALGGREQHLLALLAAGLTDESAAARLGVSVRTVRRTMSSIMDRLGARSRFEAGLKAARRDRDTSMTGHAGADTVCVCAGTCHRG